MRYRELGRTGWKVSDVSFGAWAIGGSWGNVSDAESLAALHQAIDSGVNYLDTADVYGMGRSERLIAQLKRERKEEIVVATKAGRHLSPHTADGYNSANLVAENCAASDLPELPAETMQGIREIYDTRIRGLVHARW